MTKVVCGKCLGLGWITDARKDVPIECPNCVGNGYLEIDSAEKAIDEAFERRDQ